MDQPFNGAVEEGLLAYQFQPSAADGGSDPPYEEDFFQRIVNVNWGTVFYVIIAATNNDYATSNLKSVKILATRSEFVEGDQGSSGPGSFEPLSGTLVECSGNAGADFITLRPTSSNPLGLEYISIYVCPHQSVVKDNWFDYVRSPFDSSFADDNGFPLHPFLWIARTWSGSPNVMKFRIRHTPGPKDVPDPKTAQAYPTSGNNSWPYGNGWTYVITGWNVVAYRLDKEGTGAIYPGDQPSWNTDVIVEFVGGPAPIDPFKGLKFGKDPP